MLVKAIAGNLHWGARATRGPVRDVCPRTIEGAEFMAHDTIVAATRPFKMRPLFKFFFFLVFLC